MLTSTLLNARPGSVNLICDGPQTLDFLFTSLVRILKTCVIEILGGSSDFDVQRLTDADLRTLDRVFLSFGIRLFIDRASSVAILLRKEVLSDYRLVLRIPNEPLVIVHFDYVSPFHASGIATCHMSAMGAWRGGPW